MVVVLKLSGFQIFWIVATVEIVMAVMLRISPAIDVARQDAWISMLAAGLMGLAMTFLAVRVSLYYPGQTLAQFSQVVLGKWGGRLVALPYFVSWFILAGDVLRAFADFIHLVLLDQTPLWLIMAIMLGLMCYLTAVGGITGIGRFCEIAGPITFITIIVSILLNWGNMEWNYLRPFITDSGFSNIWKASLAPASFFGESFLLLAIIGFMQNTRKAMSASLLSVGLTVFMVFAATVMVILVFGPSVAAELRFPYFMLVRSIDIMEFIQNVDIFVLFIWIFGVYAKVSFYLFLTSYELSNWFKVKGWRKFIWFCAPLIFIIATVYPDEVSILQVQKFWQNIVIPVCAIGIPLLLWIVSAARNRKKAVKL